MRQSLWREVWILTALVTLGWLLGTLMGYRFLFTSVALLCYIALQLRQLYRLHQWLLSDKHSEPPDAAGPWGDVFNEVRKLVRGSERRTDELVDTLTRFQSAAAAMPDAVVILTEEEEIEWANPPAAILLGIHFPRDAGMRVSNLLRDPDLTDYLKSGHYSEPLEIDSPA